MDLFQRHKQANRLLKECSLLAHNYLCIFYLENMTNSRKDRVGKTQLHITDHDPPSLGIGGIFTPFLSFILYIFPRASDTAYLHLEYHGGKKEKRSDNNYIF